MSASPAAVQLPDAYLPVLVEAARSALRNRSDVPIEAKRNVAHDHRGVCQGASFIRGNLDASGERRKRNKGRKDNQREHASRSPRESFVSLARLAHRYAGVGRGVHSGTFRNGEYVRQAYIVFRRGPGRKRKERLA